MLRRATATPLEREIPLAEIDPLWVAEKRNTGTRLAAYILMAGVAFIGLGYLALATDQAGH
jgi:hypothetical protein